MDDAKSTATGWLAAHLHYSEPWEEFLVQAVSPFVGEALREKLAEQFFFVRFWERGPHIRLRFKGVKSTLDTRLKPKLNAHFEEYFESYPRGEVESPRPADLSEPQLWHPNNTIQFDDYLPEVARYGGTAGMSIAERQFQASSQAVLSVIEEGHTWSYERALGAAIQLHLGFAHATGMDLSETCAFFTHIFRISFGRAYGRDPMLSVTDLRERHVAALGAFRESFEDQAPCLLPIHRNLWSGITHRAEFNQEWMNAWVSGMLDISDSLYTAMGQGRLQIPEWFRVNPALTVDVERQRCWSILSSYIHMTNNRLGLLNRDESFVAYVIMRSLAELRKGGPTN